MTASISSLVKGMERSSRPGVVSRPRILSNSGENFFFASVLLEMIEISQGFKTFESI
jgi:hypothetical protein